MSEHRELRAIDYDGRSWAPTREDIRKWLQSWATEADILIEEELMVARGWSWLERGRGGYTTKWVRRRLGGLEEDLATICYDEEAMGWFHEEAADDTTFASLWLAMDVVDASLLTQGYGLCRRMWVKPIDGGKEGFMPLNKGWIDANDIAEFDKREELVRKIREEG